MTKILFICHGNICRSTMAEFYMKHIVNKAGLNDSIYIESAGTSCEEIGNDIHYGTKQKLDEMGIPYTRCKARQVTVDDYHNFDYLIIMDENNGRNLKRIIGNDIDSKVYKAMSFVGESSDVKDPWYTGNFDETYDDISRSCDALLELIKARI
ncbi:low molecular weight phosphotyrosine protein phosphatase [Veillonella parvula]|uniref:low molecular weight protein-tyrosine-phosphatase n=1 Tax=Veillonella parvula TaxID=29466 RepID=UPI001D083DD2|nr:low molecular weight protein-tyrosine-phosphatase [Veillonella parvula]MCB6804983.1 low molecular weight phosphotyrosine protein phosphatase [Veillonella parvula]MCQ4925957.1 low molecular weight phosphotyrosine protein phosphatase [Veillonella parvula]MCQ4957147.1 low molecular weight phosphotyrosine protein phosphatase [Veillonella parvula]